MCSSAQYDIALETLFWIAVVRGRVGWFAKFADPLRTDDNEDADDLHEDPDAHEVLPPGLAKEDDPDDPLTLVMHMEDRAKVHRLI